MENLAILIVVPVDFQSEYRVYYEDTDAAGVVYHANYLKFMERARTDWLASLGYLPQQPSRDWGVIFAVRSTALDFHRPASLGQVLNVSVDWVKIRGASLDVKQRITCQNKVLVNGTLRIACLDSKQLKVRRIPAEIKNRIIK